MPKVFIIAEAALTWLHGGLEAAYRSIRAAKECGADAWKSQWTSDHEAMEMRRGVERGKYKRLQWGAEALPLLKAECERVGIEFMCTVFIEKDVETINQYVSRFKVSAFESNNHGLAELVGPMLLSGKEVIVSVNEGIPFRTGPKIKSLHCVSKYPTQVDKISLWDLRAMQRDGLSDHTTSTLTGAVAVGAGARIIEKHVRLSDTPEDDPDFGHSLVVDRPKDECFYCDGPRLCKDCRSFGGSFAEYVGNVREAELML